MKPKILLIDFTAIPSEFQLAFQTHDIYSLEFANSIQQASKTCSSLFPSIFVFNIKRNYQEFVQLFEYINIENQTVIVISDNIEFINETNFSVGEYLFNPISHEDLNMSILRVLKKINISHKNQQTTTYNYLTNEIQLKNIPIKDIIKINSNGSYSKIHRINGQSLLTSKNIGQYQYLVNQHNFFRIHKKCLLNLRHLQEIKTGKNPIAILKNGTAEFISRQKWKDLQTAFNSFNSNRTVFSFLDKNSHS
jgi:two-component system LytT family response regulator